MRKLWIELPLKECLFKFDINSKRLFQKYVFIVKPMGYYFDA